MNQTLKEMISMLGGYAIFAAALAYLLKTAIAHWLDKSTESFKAELQLRAEREMERFRTDLEIQSQQRIEKFTTLHEKRHEALANLFALLHDVASQITAYLGDLPPQNDVGRRLADALGKTESELNRAVHMNHLYLPPRVATMIVQFMEGMTGCVGYIRLSAIGDVDGAQRYKADTEEWKKGEGKRGLLARQIAVEFQAMLGVEEKTGTEPSPPPYGSPAAGSPSGEGYEEQIFCAGVRAPNAVRDASPAPGVGLTICRRLLNALGGDIRLTNRCNPTEFTVYLPAGEGA